MFTLKMKWLTRSQSRQSLDWFLLGVVVSSLILLTCSQSHADPANKGCGEGQHKCLCGIPRCIEPELVRNGVQDCQDGGSDEGQWDPSKCAIKNNTSEDIRFKRAALSELSRVTNLGATTTFFGGDRGRTRPVGLLTTTMGSFVTSGTTTEYITKVLATYIKGTYARILSTSSRIYHAIPTDGGDMMDMIRPTGFIASTVSNEINGYATTAHTTDFYRTYIDGTYAQLVSSYSNVHYPPWYTDPIMATAVPQDSNGREVDPGVIYATPAVEPERSYESAYLFEDAGARVKTVIVPSKIVSQAQPTLLPKQLSGRFDSKNGRNVIAELGIDLENTGSDRLRAFRPNNNRDSEVKVTGTHGKFVHTDNPTGDETTYNVFTGTYVQNLKTFLFFFGNTVIEPSKSSLMESGGMRTLQVENGPERSNNVVLDMSENLKVIVPSKNQRIPIEGSIEGQHMEGLLVEIESSEPGGDFITVDGGDRRPVESRTPSDPRIDQVTVTIGKGKPVIHKSSFSTSFSSMRKGGKDGMDENEIPTGRRVPNASGSLEDAASSIRPTSARQVSLPTFTVGQEDGKLEVPSYETAASVENPTKDKSEEDVVVNVQSSVTKGSRKNSAPVFQRPTPKPDPTPAPAAIPRQPINARPPQAQNYRSHRAFVDIVDAENDLQSAASTGRATVTYVGFADFTTTVGNTVIVFMPRTKIIEDMSIQASRTQSPTIDATRFVSQRPPAATTEETTTTTTQRQREVETTTSRIKSSTSTTTPRSQKNLNKNNRLTTTPKTREEDDEEITTEISPSETTVLVSGTQTLFANLKQKQGVKTLSFEEATPQLPASSPVFSAPTRKTVFPSRSRFLPKHLQSKSSPPSVKSKPESTPIVQSPVSSNLSPANTVASTAVYQTDKVNPTGLVTSIGGSVVRDKTTTLFTSLIYGTFIGDSYAQVIKSTSTVFFLLPSKSSTNIYSSIRPTSVAKFASKGRAKTSAVSYEVTTTERVENGDEDADDETTTNNSVQLQFDRVETSTTTESSSSGNKKKESSISSKEAKDEDFPTTTGKAGDADEYDEVYTTTTSSSSSSTTTPRSKDDNAAGAVESNEIETGRKVAGRPQDQVLVNNVDVEATPVNHEHDNDQTIFITRTLPTTLYRTYTYYTTFFLPHEDSTITSVTSREVTSTAVGLVKKTFASFLPSSVAGPSASVLASKGGNDNEDEEEEEREGEEEEIKPSQLQSSEIVDLIEPSSVQVIYKTFFTTYTYLTTFFTGQTSSISSREEIVSNIVTLTQTPGGQSSSSPALSSSAKIVPTSSEAVQSQNLRTAKPSASRSGKFSVIRRSKIISRTPESSPSSASVDNDVVEPSSSVVEPSSTVDSEEVEPTASLPVLTATVFKTFYTTYTYFTTLFNNGVTSIKSRTEVLTNVVPTVTRIIPSSPVTVSVAATAHPSEDEEEVGEEEDEIQEADVVSPVPYGRETTMYTTYTYITTSFKDGTSFLKSSMATYTKVLVGDDVIRSGLVETAKIEPTKISGRTVPRASASISPRKISQQQDSDTDLNEVGSHLSETSETTVPSTKDEPEVTTEANDYYELDGSEATTTTEKNYDAEDENNQEHKQQSSDSQSVESDDNEVVKGATPALKTFFTTFTFYTTYYKGGTSTVTSRLETQTNIASDGSDESVGEATESVAAPVEPTYPITYYTTYTFWTTAFQDGTPVVTSREETVSNIVTPGVDDTVAATASANGDKIEATSAVPEIELTTFFTTYTYYTTSYLQDQTVVTSRLETITNIVSGSSTSPAVAVDPTSTITASAAASGRAVGSIKPEIVSNDHQQGDEDYDLPTGLLSTIVSSEVVDHTTTVHSTDVFGTYIDGIYAQVLESTSELIKPTASFETVFINDATATPIGLLSINQGNTRDADGAATTYYKKKAFGTKIDGRYAQLLESTSSIHRNTDVTLDPSENQFKTGLVRIVDGSVVEGDQTTYYTSKILGTFIDHQYAQVIESTSRYVINPSKSEDFTTLSPTKLTEIEGSEGTTEEVPTTTEKEAGESDEGKETTGLKGNLANNRRFAGRNRGAGAAGGSSRLSFTASSKSFTPLITPFASRSRPAFAPRRRQSSAIVVTRTDVTPTVTASPAATLSSSPASRGSAFTNRRNNKLNKPAGGDVEVTTQASVSSSSDAATPRLPFGAGASRSRFQRPGGASRPAVSPNNIQPTSSSSARGGSSSPLGSSSRRGGGGSGFSSRVSASVPGARGRGSSSAGFSRGGASTAVNNVGSSSSVGGARGSASSRFNPRGRSTSSILPTATQSTTVKPTVAPQEEEYEVIEYEYEEHPSSASSTTSTTPKTSTAATRLGGASRFRLNPKLSTPTVQATTPTNPPRTTPRSIPFIRKGSFTRPTPSTRGTTTTAEADGNGADDESAPAVKEPVVVQKPASRPSFSSNRQRTTPIPVQVSTTTRRTFAPRARPASFPSRGLVRPSSTASTSTENYDSELEYEESKHYPAAGSTNNGNVSSTAESAAASPAALALSGESADNVAAEESAPSEVRVRPPSGGPWSPTNGHHGGSRYGATDVVNVDDLVDSGSEFFEHGVPAPYETYEYLDDDAVDGDVSRRGRFSGREKVLRRSVRRHQSRYQRPTEASTTTSTPSSRSRFRSRYRQSEVTTPRSTPRGRYTSGASRSRGGTTYSDRGSGRYDSYSSSNNDEYIEPSFQLGVITVTHYIPSETQIPVVNGKVTEYKTILTPSASKEVLEPYQYTRSEYQGTPVLVFNNELTSTPSFGVTEVTRFFIRESTTTSVTFTPTTIRGRRTSFSHIVPSTVYSVEPVVSTIAANPLTDQNQLTNLLLNQLLGNLNLNPANLLGLKQPQQQHIQQNNGGMNEPATPITHFNTKTTSYVTTVTDFTSTVIPITLHGKAIKTTIVESSTHVITATEFITESTVITPAPTQQPQLIQPIMQTLNNGFNPALLQGLLQQQQQLLLQQQQQILPTQPPQILQTVTQQHQHNTNKDKDFEQEEESVKEVSVEKAPQAKKEEFSVVTLYVSGRNPGEFTTVLSTVPFEKKVKRSANYHFNDDDDNEFNLPNLVRATRANSFPEQLVEPTQLDSSMVTPQEYYWDESSSLDNQIPYNNNNDNNNPSIYLHDSYSSLSNNNNNANNHNNNNHVLFRPTQSLDSVLGDVSKLLNSQSVSSYL